MKIAQVAPLYERVPPVSYGGTERIVSYLTEELIRQGHELTLFASGDSMTAGRLMAPCERSLRLDSKNVDPMAYNFLLLEHVFQEARSFDVIHFHIDYLHFSLSRRQRVPNVTTLHGRLDIPNLAPLYREFSDMPVVSISNDQRRRLLGSTGSEPFITGFRWIFMILKKIREIIWPFLDEFPPKRGSIGQFRSHKP